MAEMQAEMSEQEAYALLNVALHYQSRYHPANWSSKLYSRIFISDPNYEAFTQLADAFLLSSDKEREKLADFEKFKSFIR